jgi:hypothetical protein
VNGALGALGFQFVSADAAHAWVHAYYNAFVKRQKKLADYRTNPNIALVSFFMCAKTDEEAREARRRRTFFQFALRFYGQSAGPARPPAGTVNMWDEYNKWKKANPEAHAAALRGGLIGSPETHPAQAAQVPGLEHRSGRAAQPGRQEHARAHLRIARAVRKEVMPEFHAAHPQLLKWKEQVLNREIELDGNRHLRLYRPVRWHHEEHLAGHTEGAGSRIADLLSRASFSAPRTSRPMSALRIDPVSAACR